MTPELKVFDHLIYCGNDFFDRAVRLKTWSPASHIEVYAGAGWSWASRNGQGVNRYHLRHDELVAVLRPVHPFHFERARLWFEHSARGQKYDWLGLLCFVLAVRQGSPRKMFCSEFAAGLDRAAGLHSFHPLWSADKIAPGMFLQSPAFEWVWFDPQKLP